MLHEKSWRESLTVLDFLPELMDVSTRPMNLSTTEKCENDTKKRLHANVLSAGSIHIAVIDAAPLYTFHHGELCLEQPLSGIVIALVGLLRILRVSKLSTSADATNEFSNSRT